MGQLLFLSRLERYALRILHLVPAALQPWRVLYRFVTSPSGAMVKYMHCNERVCVRVCVCLCVSVFLSLSASIAPEPHARSLPIFSRILPWLGPPPAG